MLKIIMLATLTLLGAGGALADPQKWDLPQEWIAAEKKLLAQNQQGVKDLVRYRKGACTSRLGEPRRVACLAAYDLVITRRSSQAAEVEMWLKLVEIGMQDGSKLLNDAAIAEYNRRDRETTEIWEKVWALFPAPL
jgi:hypothetical protein